MTETSWSELLKALSSADEGASREAAEALLTTEPTAAQIQGLASLATQHDNARARTKALGVLREFGAQSVPGLASLLESERPETQQIAAQLLGHLRLDEAAAALISRFEALHPTVRPLALGALGEIGTPAAGREIERLLALGPAEVSGAALDALEAMGRVPPLEILLKLKDDPAAGPAAIRALGRVFHPVAFLALAQALHTPLRSDAVRALGVRTRALTVDAEETLRRTLKGLEVDGWLSHLLLDDAPETRRGALKTVAALSRVSLAPLVLQAGGSPHTSDLARDVLSRLGVRGLALCLADSESLKALSSDSRALLGDVLRVMSEPSLVAPLRQLVACGDPELAGMAVRALGRSRAASAIEPLAALLGDGELGWTAGRSLLSLFESFPLAVVAAVRAAADRGWSQATVHALAGTDPDAFRAVFRTLTTHEHERVRVAAVDCAAALNEADVHGLLSQLSTDPSPLVRRAVLRWCGRKPGPAFDVAVEHALADRDVRVVATAVTLLAERHGAQVAPRLEAFVANEHAAVALAAVMALSTLGALTARAAATAVAHPDADVARAALLYSSGREFGLALAEDGLSDRRWDVRAAAARALATAGHREGLVPLHLAIEHESNPLTRDVLLEAAKALAER